MPAFHVNPRWAAISELVPGLFISGVSALDRDLLSKLQIDCIINATSEVPNLNLPGVRRMKLWLDDTDSTDISANFDPIADQIEHVLRDEGKVLVHCVAGVSRSASLCLAYLLKFRCKSLRDAYHLMSLHRAMVRPNLGFWRQLIDYEVALKGQSSVRIVRGTDEEASESTPVELPDVYLPIVIPGGRESPTGDKENFAPNLLDEPKERRFSGNKTQKFVPILDSVPECELHGC